MHLSKYMSKNFQQFQEFLGLRKAHTWIWGLSGKPTLFPALTAGPPPPQFWQCSGHVCSLCVRLILLNQGEDTLLVPFAAISFTGAKCSLSICWLIDI